MLVSTGDIQNFVVTEYLGITTGQAMRGGGLIKDTWSKLTDMIGGKAKGYEEEISKATQEAMESMFNKAREAGATAVIGVKHSISTMMVGNGGLFVITTVGTAVKGHPKEGSQYLTDELKKELASGIGA